MLQTDSEKISGLSAYIDGKMKRYSLLFSVNGGAFAIAKLMTGTDKTGNAVLLGNLKLWHLALGSIIFTVLVVIDIGKFGTMMRDNFLGKLSFGVGGRAILIILGLLIVVAWLLVAFG